MHIIRSIGKLIKTYTPSLLKGQSKVIKNGCEKLINPELIESAFLIQYSKLNIPKSQVEDVLSLYQKYLRETKLNNGIDFNSVAIDDYISKFFIRDGGGGFSTSNPLCSKFISNHSLDILKSMIRSNIKDISPEAKALLNDLKYYGLNSKTADIVHKFEENGVNLWTSNKFNGLNDKLETFLEFTQKNKLKLTKEINLFGTDIGEGFAAEYNSIANKISMNPAYLTTKGLKLQKADGTLQNVNDDYESFLHEYFHFLHENSIGLLKYNKLGNKTLFGYLCEKDIPKFSKTVERYILDSRTDLYGSEAVIPTDFGKIEELESAIAFIKEHASEIFGNDAKKAMAAMDKSFAKCQNIAMACGEYATKTPLETVAECGRDFAIGKKLPNEIEDLLSELGCPNLKV